jgi:hypothetical protein
MTSMTCFVIVTKLTISTSAKLELLTTTDTSIIFRAGQSVGSLRQKRKNPKRIDHLGLCLGGNGGIRTLDEALHPILP